MRSTNGGGSWTDITGALPAVPFNTITLQPAFPSPTTAYVGSDFGVYENDAVWTTNTWFSITNNLPAVAVEELRNGYDGRLIAATHGRGIWQLQAFPKPVPDGKFIAGTPLKASKGSGSNINVSFDAATCPDPGYYAFWGNLTPASLSSYTYSGAECAITSGGAITTIPAGTSAFFIVAGNDGTGGESYHTQDSGGTWHGQGFGYCSVNNHIGVLFCP
jgi:hypothetical protein